MVEGDQFHDVFKDREDYVITSPAAILLTTLVGSWRIVGMK